MSEADVEFSDGLDLPQVLEQHTKITGTLIWYYYICRREVWLVAHQLTPDQDHTNVYIGRFIQEQTYTREKKELEVGNSKVDVFRMSADGLVIGEIKKSSKFRLSARMQLAFYLQELKMRGVEAKGELRFPQEKRKEEVILDEGLARELEMVCREIIDLVNSPKPPQPQKIKYCKNCAYGEFCWS